MTSIESAGSDDPTLYCAYFGGPRDGMRSGDLPAELSGRKLTGLESRLPLAQPAEFSIFAVYVCTSETQIDGFWRLDFAGLVGPDGQAFGPTPGPTPAPSSEDVEDATRVVRLADRFALQQSWWIASEIARRNGALQISRVGDDAFHAILLVHGEPTGPRIQFDLPSGASWLNVDGEIERLGWTEVLESDDAHGAVRRIEAASTFSTPASAAPTNRRTIVYRVAAALLAAKIDDRHGWQIVPAPLATDEQQAAETLATLGLFASTGPQIDLAYQDMAELVEHATALGVTPLWHEPFWLVLRDLEPVMVLDEAGYAHLTAGVCIDLLRVYRGLGRDVAAVAGLLLLDPDLAVTIASSREESEG